MVENKRKPPPRDKGFQPGKSGNPGGLSARQHQVRQQLHTWLASEPMSKRFKTAYIAALEDGNAAILKDMADRLLGKVKEQVELSGDGERPLLGVTPQDILEALRGKP